MSSMNTKKAYTTEWKNKRLQASNSFKTINTIRNTLKAQESSLKFKIEEFKTVGGKMNGRSLERYTRI